MRGTHDVRLVSNLPRVQCWAIATLNEVGRSDRGDTPTDSDWIFGKKDVEHHPMKPQPQAQPQQLYKNVGRNDPCPCGSGKKYKKCCLDGAVPTTTSTSTPASPASLLPHVCTMTGEIFIPIRLYYEVHNLSGIEAVFKKLCCMDFDPTADRWTWLFDNETKNLKFKNPYSSIPAHRRPIILGSFFSRTDTEMYLDIGSVDRAVKAVQFFDKHIDRSVAEIKYFAIYNKITSSEAEHPGSCFDNLFSEVRTDLIEQKMEEHIARMGEAVKSGRMMDIINDRRFELVEALHVNFYEDGIKQLKSSLEMREAVAVARWSGNPDYCMNDLIKDALFKRGQN